MSYKKFGTKLDNRKFFPVTSIEYEKNPHSILVHGENNMQDQQNYTYGMPLQDDIFQYRYDSFLLGNRDGDIQVKPYTEIKLPKKVENKEIKEDSPIKENFEIREKSDNVVCGVGEDSYSICGANQNLYKILDPRFNLREAAKNCILLEDHLFQYGKRCADCIKKHCLMIEGFLEEGVTLDKNREHTDEFNNSITEFRDIFKNLSIKLSTGTITDFDCVEIAQQIRKLRKPLCQKYATFF